MRCAWTATRIDPVFARHHSDFWSSVAVRYSRARRPTLDDVEDVEDVGRSERNGIFFGCGGITSSTMDAPKRRLTTATFASAAAMDESDERSVARIRVWCTADPDADVGSRPTLLQDSATLARASGNVSATIAARPTRPTHPPDVTEGYSTHHLPVYGYSAPPSPSRTAMPLVPSDNDIFRSAKDTLHQVRSAWPSGVRPDRSPRKRGRADSEHHTAIAADGLSMDLDSDDEPVTFILGPSASSYRPTIPLRRPRGRFTETQSLPVGAFPFAGGSSDDLDDEWGAGTFSRFAVGSLE